MFCTKCGQANAECASFCAACGTKIGAAGAVPAPQERSDALELYQACVGPSNQGYYVSRFARYLKGGRAGLSWNWPAFFLTFYWFLYRKMWRNAFVYFMLPHIGFLPILVIGAYFSDSSETALGLAYAGWVAAFLLLPPMFANALYFRHCRNKIEEVTAIPSTRERQVGELLAQGGTNKLMPIVLAAILILPVLGIVAAVAIPAYQSYVTKSKLSEAESFGMNAAHSVAKYYYEHEKVPSSLEEAGFSASLPAGVRELAVDPKDASVAIRVETGDPAVDGKRLLLVPALDEENSISWTCISREIAQEYLPRQCKSGDEGG